jgi:linoleoyl-CoA desaturase
MYTFIIFGLPLILTDLTWWQVLIGFLVMQFTAGSILSLVFQMAHVVEGPEQPLPDAQGKMNDSLIVHQLKTTSDFSRGNKLLSWYVGGLNFQVEHHLFPRICHVHYRALAPIVEHTAKEFNIPYFAYDNFFDALRSHFKVLKRLGREQVST